MHKHFFLEFGKIAISNQTPMQSHSLMTTICLCVLNLWQKNTGTIKSASPLTQRKHLSLYETVSQTVLFNHTVLLFLCYKYSNFNRRNEI